MTQPKPVLLVDTREQKPWEFKAYKERFAHVVRMKLDSGDYSVLGWEDKVSFERKSLSDLVSTLTAGRDRFLREMERLQDYHYAAIVVEASFNAVANPPNGRYAHSRINPKSIVGMIQAIQLRYNVDIIFAGSRANAEAIVVQRIEAICGKA